MSPCPVQEERLSTLPLSRRGSVESLSARPPCLSSSDNKRMSADFSELEPKMPFAPAGQAPFTHAAPLSAQQKVSPETRGSQAPPLGGTHSSLFLLSKEEG